MVPARDVGIAARPVHMINRIVQLLDPLGVGFRYAETVRPAGVPLRSQPGILGAVSVARIGAAANHLQECIELRKIDVAADRSLRGVEEPSIAPGPRRHLVQSRQQVARDETGQRFAENRHEVWGVPVPSRPVRVLSPPPEILCARLVEHRRWRPRGYAVQLGCVRAVGAFEAGHLLAAAVPFGAPARPVQVGDDAPRRRVGVVRLVIQAAQDPVIACDAFARVQDVRAAPRGGAADADPGSAIARAAAVITFHGMPIPQCRRRTRTIRVASRRSASEPGQWDRA